MESISTFGLIGGGWRASFYLRIAATLPHMFRVSGILLRNPDNYGDFLAKWNIPVYRTAAELAKDSDFLVLSVSKSAAASWISELAAAGIPVLAETPPAANRDEYEQLLEIAATDARIQVAEQYPLQPHHQARTAYIRSGAIGDVRHVQVSSGHGYHGISLIRRWLAIEPHQPCEVIGSRISMPIGDVPGRNSSIPEEQEGVEVQDIAIFRFGGGKSAVLDFSRSQYFSPIRRNRILIRGTLGEIRDNDVYRKTGPGQFESLSFERVQGGQEGSLFPLSLQRIRAGAKALYLNPFNPFPLTDEEIAIAEALMNMDRYLRQGVSFYSLAEALADVRLDLAMERAFAEVKPVAVD